MLRSGYKLFCCLMLFVDGVMLLVIDGSLVLINIY